MAAEQTDEELWDADQTAKFLKVPKKTLYQWNWRGEGPTAYKVGRWLRYVPDEVRSWLADQKVIPAA